ncbi:hypothetical protein Tco_1320153 [Tanacetum coccineum]
MEKNNMDLSQRPKSSSGHDYDIVVVDRLTNRLALLTFRGNYKTEKFTKIDTNDCTRHVCAVSKSFQPDGQFTRHTLASLSGRRWVRDRHEYDLHPRTDGQSKKERLKTLRSREKKAMLIRGVNLLNSKLETVVLLSIHGTVEGTFVKKGKLAPRYVGPFEIVECVGPVAYRLKLPQELSCVHDMFHVSNLKKCLAEPDVQVPLDEIEIDENLRFVEEPIEIIETRREKAKAKKIHMVQSSLELSARS